MHTTAIIVAAGKGVRMGKPIGKQFLLLGGRPILAHTLSIFDQSPVVDNIILVLSQNDKAYGEREIVAKMSLATPTVIVTGGATRQDSVFSGIAQVSDDTSIVLIHDAVRPFVQPHHIEETAKKAGEIGACSLALPVTDTIKAVNDDKTIQSTLERKTLWMAQTPQAFRLSVIRRAHEVARKKGYYGTDDAQLVEKLGLPVMVVQGSPDNIKITVPHDLLLSEAILKQYQNRRQKIIDAE